jgi:hypothetical protein
MHHELRFTVIERHISPWDAHVSRALLESEGIPAFLATEHHVSVNWPMSLMLGEVRVLVRAEDEKVARIAFALRDSGALEAALLAEQPAVPLACGHCGAIQFRDQRNWASVILAVVLWLTTRIIYPPSKRRRCMSCGIIS